MFLLLGSMASGGLLAQAPANSALKEWSSSSVRINGAPARTEAPAKSETQTAPAKTEVQAAPTKSAAQAPTPSTNEALTRKGVPSESQTKSAPVKTAEVPKFIKDEGQLAHPGDQKRPDTQTAAKVGEGTNATPAQAQLRAPGAPEMQPNTDVRTGEKRDYTRGSPSNGKAPQQVIIK